MEVDVQYLLLLDPFHVDDLNPIKNAKIHISAVGFREPFQKGRPASLTWTPDNAV